MPKVLFFSDPSNGRPGLGATIRLDSGEPCMISIAADWVRVKKTRWGLWGQLLFAAKDARVSKHTAVNLRNQFPNNLLPPGFTDRLLIAFANAVMHCKTADEVARVLNDARKRLRYDDWE